MKKFLILAIAAMLSMSAAAQVTVTGVWAFSISNIQGTYFREILNQANRIQTKYKFVVEHKPGAGGAVGASYVNNHTTPVLLGTAAAFYVRPFLYTTTNTYTFDQFKPVLVLALTPAALVTKNQELSEILNKQTISISTAGTGSASHLMALKFKEYYPNKQIQIVPYKSTTDALFDVLGGHVDLTFEFIGDAEAKGAKILGTTGRVKIKNYKQLKDMGYPNQADIVGTYTILAKKDMPDEQVLEIRNILLEAEKVNSVQELYKSDYSSKPTVLKTPDDYTRWYSSTIKNYQTLTAGQKVD